LKTSSAARFGRVWFDRVWLDRGWLDVDGSIWSRGTPALALVPNGAELVVRSEPERH